MEQPESYRFESDEDQCEFRKLMSRGFCSLFWSFLAAYVSPMGSPTTPVQTKASHMLRAYIKGAELGQIWLPSTYRTPNTGSENMPFTFRLSGPAVSRSQVYARKELGHICMHILLL